MFNKISVIMSLLLVASTAFAATDGAVGATSTGTATISVTIPKLIRLRGLADFAFGSYAGSSDLNDDEDVSVSTNYGTAARTYQVTGSGSGGGGAFTITDGTSTIAYNTYWNDVTGTTGRAALTSGTPLTTQGGASKPLGTNTDNANYSVNIPEANLQAVDAATYSGTLTLVVAPE